MPLPRSTEPGAAGGGAPAAARVAAWQDRLGALVRSARLGVMTDLDGTVSPIARTPEQAVVDPACASALARLARLLPRVAVVSGRRAGDARARVGIPELVYVGNHGLERWQGEELQVAPEALRWAPAVTAACAALVREGLPPGVRLEAKGVTASIHHRLAPPETDLGALVLRLAALARGHGLELTTGKMVYELRPPVAIDKGAAVEALATEAALDACLFLGDDRTDLDAFRGLARLAARGLATASVAVLGVDSSAEVYEAADLTVEGPAGAGELLAWLVEARVAARGGP